MPEQPTVKIRIAGFGGQGVILGGIIMGKAACIYEGRHSTMIQSFGPEARGGACSAQVIVSSEPIAYPYIKESDVLVVMSQEAYRIFAPQTKPGGQLLYEEDLVELMDPPAGVRCYGIPATRFAEEIRSKILLNIVMLGFFGAVTGVIDVEAMKSSIKNSVPRGTELFNLRAFDRGYEHGMALRAEEQKEGHA
jgi:2-oxoglutarate ferredoxin oxidoreductase subunit gamma